jgi:hypothetical protein
LRFFSVAKFPRHDPKAGNRTDIGFSNAQNLIVSKHRDFQCHKGGNMKKQKKASRSISVFLVASAAVFSLFAVIAVVSRTPIFPQAIAVDIQRQEIQPWMDYIYLHESWHIAAAFHSDFASCAK